VAKAKQRAPRRHVASRKIRRILEHAGYSPCVASGMLIKPGFTVQDVNAEVVAVSYIPNLDDDTQDHKKLAEELVSGYEKALKDLNLEVSRRVSGITGLPCLDVLGVSNTSVA
jgi:hypothetical protein